MSYQEFIKSCLEEASQIANEKFGKVTGTVKEGDSNQVLTEADLAIGEFIIKQIQKHFPDYNIIDEEAGIIDKGSEFTWVVDPIDGTSNFANGVPQYGIMIGLLHKNIPIAGGVSLPAFSHTFIAEKGLGTFRDGQKVQVTKEKELLNCLVAYQIDGHQENPQTTYDEVNVLADIILASRNLRTGGCVYDYLLVAEGKYGGAMMRTSKIWDVVAPQIIIEEAGGIYTDFLGEPIDYTNPLNKVEQNFTSCAASPELHKQLQDIIHRSR